MATTPYFCSLMWTRKLKLRLSFFAGLLCWLLFTIFDLYQLFIERYQLQADLSDLLPQVLFTGFVLSTLVYFRYIITKAESINFMDLLWRVFITGLITTVGSLLIRLFFYVFDKSAISENPVTINFFYHILIALVVIFLVSTFVVWKRLILYQKNKNLIQIWSFFEYALLGSLLFDLFGNKFLSINFNIAFIFLGGFALVLSFNLKWIAYLNFKQKWKSILFILLSGIYVYHFLLNLINFSSTEVLTIDLLDRSYVVSLFVFIILYSSISVLVTLFNLPTSSVFERKLQEAIDFQKLSHLPKGDTSVENTADLLIESSMSAVFADAAWLEVKGAKPILITRGLSKESVIEIKSLVKQESVRAVLSMTSNGEVAHNKSIATLQHDDFKSIIAVPIMVQEKQLGSLVLLQEVAEAFNREMVEIIITFVNQASISIENAKLIREAIETERYKEELKIAKNVQKSLLPQKLIHNDSFDVLAYSMAADEVGGDYYDLVEPTKGVFSLIIGDVSGKGTSAAFNMAQMKGIFHSLVLQKGSPKDFMQKANKALSGCLEKSSFITAIYFEINTKARSIAFSRAGHCPPIFYSAQSKTTSFLECNGLGLGILRNSDFNQYVEEKKITYSPGDILLLYTDGIVEAKNATGLQFGAENLKNSLLTHLDKPLDQLRDGMISDLITFLDGVTLDDDYTLTLVKFEK